MGTVVIWWALRRAVPWCRFGTAYVRRDVVRRLAIPALSYMGFPLGNALSNQGFVMAVGALINPIAVVVFTVTRTLVNFVRQAVAMVNDAIWPELSAAFGADRRELLRHLHRRGCQMSFWLGTTFVVVLAVSGGQIIQIWTTRTVDPNFGLLYILLAVGLLNAVWLTSSVVPVAGNRHSKISIVYFVGTTTSLALSVLLLGRMGLVGGGLALLLVEIIMITTVLPTSLKIAGDQLSDFVVGIFNFRLGFEAVKTLFARATPTP